MRVSMSLTRRRRAGRLQRAILAITLVVSILPVPSASAVSAICFGAPSPSEVVLGAVSPAAGALGQFGGDGAPDLLTIGTSADVALRIGNGSGGFSFVLNEPVSTAPAAIAVGKIDGDAHDDFLAGGIGSASVSVRLGNGAGGFTTKSDIPVVTD